MRYAMAPWRRQEEESMLLSLHRCVGQPRSFQWLVASTLIFLGLAAPAQAVDNAPSYALTVGKALPVELKEDYRTHALPSDGFDLVEVKVKGDRELQLTGKKPGETSLVVFGKKGGSSTYRLVITAAKPAPAKASDTRSALQQTSTEEADAGSRAPKSPQESLIEKALATPGVSVRVDKGKVILEGSVATRKESDRLEQLAQRYATVGVENRLKVGSVPDVPPLGIKPAGVGAFTRRDSGAMGGGPAGERIVVTLGLAKLLTMTGNITKISFSNPAVIEAVPLGAKYLEINGLKPGLSSLIVFTAQRSEDRVGVPKEYLVEVVPSTGPGDPTVPVPKSPEELQKEIEAALQDPRITVRVTIDKDNNTLAILKGEVERERDAKNAAMLAASFVKTVQSNSINWTIPDLPPALPPPPSPDEILTRELQQETGLTTFTARKAGTNIILFGEVPTADDQAALIRLARARGPVISTTLRVTGAAATGPPSTRTTSNASISLMESELSDAEMALTERIRSITGSSTIVVRQQDQRYFLLGRVKNQEEFDRVKRAVEFTAGYRGTSGGAAGGGGAGGLGGLYPIANFVEIEGGGVIRKINIQAYVVELNKTSTKDLGITWGGLNAQSVQQTSSTIPGLSPLSGILPTAGTITIGQGTGGSGGLQRFDPIIGQIRALQSRGFARLLSSPNATTLDRTPAVIQVGGSFPIIGTTLAGGGGLATQTVTFVPFGVILSFRPEFNEGQIVLQIHSEVSAPDYGLAVTFQGARIPGLRQRLAETRLVLRPGESGVIGGLIDRNDSKSTAGIPLLSNIPVMGTLFKSRSFQKGETELMIFVTPTVEEIPAGPGLMDAAERARDNPQLPTPIGATGSTGGGSVGR